MSEDIMRESDDLTDEILDIAAERKMHWRALFLSGHEVATIAALNLGLDEAALLKLADESSEKMKDAFSAIMSGGGGGRLQ